jgi:DnaJ-class molecular chaperone
MNPYTVLQVSPQATDEEIKKKYRLLAQQNHPDKGGNVETFQQINLAYSILSDPARRKHFDSTGEYHVNNSLREEALGNLSMVLNHFINEINPDVEDLIVLMKNDANREKEQLNIAITNCLNLLAKLEKVLKKLKKKKEGENILKMFTTQRIKALENDIIIFNKKVEVCDKMLEILEDYEFSDIEFEMLMNQVISNQEVPAQ